MRNLKKSLSLILALALLVSSVFVGGIMTSAATELYTTVNTYDDDSDITLENVTWQGVPCINANDSWEYEYFGAYGPSIVQDPFSEETNNVVHFDRVKSKTNSWPACIRIYKQGTESAKTTFSLFKPNTNTTYEYEFRYYVKSTAVGVDIQIRDTYKRMHGAQDDYKYNVNRILETAVSVPAGASTDGWVTVKGQFNTGSWGNGLGLFLASQTSGEDYDAEIYIDDIRISECSALTAYNYDGENDETVYASDYTTIADLSVPERDGYILAGIYSDAEHTAKISGSTLAIDYAETGVYYGWAKLNPGEYYAGFEAYTPDQNGGSFDADITSVVSGDAYAGVYNIKVDAPANTLTAFELRDKEAFETKAGTKYVISFMYRASATAKLFAGTAKASDVPGTATAIQGADLPAAEAWTAASIEVTLDNGQKEGYVPALILKTTDSAVVEFDHVYMTYPVEETQNIENKFVTSEDWYPSLAYFDGITIPEASEVWNGGTEIPTDADNDGVYEIDTAEKLAYIIKNGGTMVIGTETVTETQTQNKLDENGNPIQATDESGNPLTNEDGTPVYVTEEVEVEVVKDITKDNCSFILTKDIYLNDISKANWLADENNSNVRAWYTSGNSTFFGGTLDGNYHTVYGVYSRYKYTDVWHGHTGGTSRGLIPAVDRDAVIKNLTVDCSNIFAENNAGVIVGTNRGGVLTIDSCTSGKNVYVESYRVGGIMGSETTSGGTTTINNCASYATCVIGSLGDSHGYSSKGLVNSVWSHADITVTNSFNANGPLTSRTIEHMQISNCFATEEGDVTTGATILTAEQMQGEDVLDEGGAMASLNESANYWTATETYPVLSASKGIEVIEIEYWDGTTQAPVDANDDGIFEINSPKELAYVIYYGGTMTIDEVVTEGCSFILTRDIYLNNLSLYDWSSFTRLPWGQTTLNEWYDTSNVAAKFSGTIDGNNHSVYGIYSHYQWTATYAGWDKGRGLIPAVADGKTANVKNLNLDCVYVQNETCGAGGFVGVNYGTAIFENCSVGEKVYIKGSYAGAFTGAANNAEGVSLTNCYSLATLNGYNDAETTAHLSGLTTNNWMSSGGYIKINNCYNAKGCIAAEGGTIKNSYATASGSVTSGVVVVTAEDMQGLNTLGTMALLNIDSDGNATRTFTATTGYPVLTSFLPADEIVSADGEATYEIWDGTSVAPTLGSGTEEDPYQITNGAELYYMVYNNGSVTYTVTTTELQTQKVQATDEEGNLLYEEDGTTPVYVQATDEDGNLLYEEDGTTPIYATEEVEVEVKTEATKDACYFVLNNDIYLNDLSKINWQTGSITQGYDLHTWRYGGSTKFQGHVDGKGHTVYGIYIHDKTVESSFGSSYSAGLFSTVRGTTTIKNLAVDYSFLHHESTAGGLVGSVYGENGNATITNCYVGSNVAVESTYAGSLVGTVAAGASITVDKCYSLATTTAKTGDAFIANLYYNSKPANVTVSNSFSAEKLLYNKNYTGALTVTNCYQAIAGASVSGVTTVTADNMKGDNVLTSSSKMAGLKAASAYIESKTDFAEANINNFVYLPAGTILEEDFAPLFFDTRMGPLTADDVMFADRMIRGAYVRFTKTVDVTKIHVPVSKAHRVAFGTAQELLASGYYDIETEIISEGLAGQPDYAVNYLFITDPHFDTQGSNGGPINKVSSSKQFELAIKMANEMDEIDFVCLGGDLMNGSHSTTDGWISAVDTYLAPINECTKPVFVLVGNHDDNVYGTVSDSATLASLNARVMTNDKWQTAIIDKYVNRTLEDGTVIDVVQNEDPYKSEKVNSKYYYYDLDNKNTRIICLNASDYEYGYDDNGEFTLIHNTSTSTNVRSNTYNGYTFWGYSKYQMKWLAEEALGTLPEDYNVIMLSHMAITKSSSGTEKYTNGTVLSDIMAAYQTKSEYANEEFGISADFTADTGRIMSYQHGHEHIMYEKYNAAPQLWQFSAATTNPHSWGLAGRIMNEKLGAIEVMSVTEGYVYKQGLGDSRTAMFINNFPVYEGDINLDTTVDICDLVALDNINEAELVTTTMPSGDLASIRKLLLGIVA